MTMNYQDLYDAVEADPNRGTVAKETGITFSRPDDRAKVNTAEPSLMRRLLAHPEFELRSYETSSDNGSKADYKNVSAETYEEQAHDARKPVYSVHGTIPIGCLKVSATARSSTGHAEVVSASVLENAE